MQSLDEGTITRLGDIADAMNKHRAKWDDLVRRREEAIIEAKANNPRASKVEIAAALGVTDTVVRRTLKAERPYGN